MKSLVTLQRQHFKHNIYFITFSQVLTTRCCNTQYISTLTLNKLKKMIIFIMTINCDNRDIQNGWRYTP